MSAFDDAPAPESERGRPARMFPVEDHPADVRLTRERRHVSKARNDLLGGHSIEEF